MKRCIVISWKAQCNASKLHALQLPWYMQRVDVLEYLAVDICCFHSTLFYTLNGGSCRGYEACEHHGLHSLKAAV